MDHYGIISILPVLTILVIAISTRKTLFAMLCGLSVASIILTPSFLDLPNTFVGYLMASFSNESMQWLCILIALFGILIALFEKSNAVIDFGNWLTKFVKTKRQALVVTSIMGIIIFLEDYLNNLTVGTTMKKVTDRLGVPREHLALTVNGMAAPVCLLIPMSSWAVYYASLFEDQGITADGTGLGAYIQSIPYAFYAWIMVIIVLLLAFGVFPKIGPLKKSYQRVAETGNLMPEGLEPVYVKDLTADGEAAGVKPQPWNFLVPLVVMIAVTIYMGIDVVVGTMAGLLVAIIMYMVQRKFTFKELMQYSYEGIMSMGFVFILTALAFAVSTANTDLGLADYVIEITLPVMKGGWLPAVTFLVCGIYAYATGCFWDLAVIIVPIVIPLAQAMGVDPILVGAAIFSGTALGSNTCLYGDGVILCSQGCEVRAHNLMLTTLPYAVIAGAISVVLYIIFGFTMGMA